MLERIGRESLQRRREEAAREHPEFVFFAELPYTHPVPGWPAHIATYEAEYPAGRDFPALRRARIEWPQRPEVTPTPRALEAAAVVEALEISASVDESRDDFDDTVLLNREVVLTRPGAERPLKVRWESAVEGRREFEKPWPASATDALALAAAQAAEVDDGRGWRAWVLAGEFVKDSERLLDDAEHSEEVLHMRLRHAWDLHVFLGTEPYEQLTASKRVPLSVALYRTEQERAARQERHSSAARELGQTLRAARRQARLDLVSAATDAELPRSRLQNIERGRPPAVDELARLAELYGLQVAELAALFGAVPTSETSAED